MANVPDVPASTAAREVVAGELVLAPASPPVDVLEAFAAHMRRRGLEYETIRKRLTALERLAEHVAPRSLLAVTHRDINGLLDGRADRQGNRTRYHWISHYKCFYRWAFSEELIGADPAARVESPRLSSRLPRPIRDEDLRLAVERADDRMRAWLLLAAYEGLRCKEIGGLHVEDVDEAAGLLHVRNGKGGKDRTVPLHPAVVDALHRCSVPTEGAVFRRPRGGAYPAAVVSSEGNGYLHGLGIDATMHQCRHWFGTAMYAETTDLRRVQELMGHSSPSTTAGYTKVALDEATMSAVRSLDVGVDPVELQVVDVEPPAATVTPAEDPVVRLLPPNVAPVVERTLPAVVRPLVVPRRRNRPPVYSDAELMEALRAWLATAPVDAAAVYYDGWRRSAGAPHSSTIAARLGSWETALTMAGYRGTMPSEIDRRRADDERTVVLAAVREWLGSPYAACCGCRYGYEHARHHGAPLPTLARLSKMFGSLEDAIVEARSGSGDG